MKKLIFFGFLLSLFFILSNGAQAQDPQTCGCIGTINDIPLELQDEYSVCLIVNNPNELNSTFDSYDGTLRWAVAYAMDHGPAYIKFTVGSVELTSLIWMFPKVFIDGNVNNSQVHISTTSSLNFAGPFSEGSEIRQVHFTGIGSVFSGIALQGRGGVKISNCTFESYNIDISSDNNEIKNNHIDLQDNVNYGIKIRGGKSNQIVGNQIKTVYVPIRLESFGETADFNSFKGNSYEVISSQSDNYTAYIRLFDNANEGKLPPTITGSLNDNSLTGNSPDPLKSAYDYIEIYKYENDGISTRIATTTAGADGTWTTSPIALVSGDYYIATATDVDGNTSAFSAPFQYLYLSCGFDQALIHLLSPANLSTFSSLDAVNLNYALENPPSATTHTVTVDVYKQIKDAQGNPVPDYSNPFEKTYTYPGTISPGSYSVSLSEFIPAGSFGTYYWRVAYANDQTTATDWSPLYQFSIPVPEEKLPMEDYLTDDNAHTNNINWVYQVNYLDDGLTRQSIVYADGLGNPRQEQVLANSVSSQDGDGNILCREYAWAENGGTPASTMTAPLNTNKFGYAYRFFDVADASGLRDFMTEDFDMVDATTGKIITPAAVESSPSNTRSVGYYYSNYNTEEPFVDNAEGYPYLYSVMEARPDAGVQLVPGAGKDFRVTSGREAEAFRGNPTPEELERVFGSEAPYADKIVKTVVFDANEVGSITYTDNEGKVIATSLTACENRNQDHLQENGTGQFASTVDVLKNDLSLTATQKSAEGHFFVPCNGSQVTLDYTIDLTSFSTYNNQCASCKYSILVEIYEDATGDLVYTTDPAPLDPGSATPDCNTSTPASLLSSVSLTLPNKGNYTIKRTIIPAFETVNGQSLRYLDGVANEATTYIENNKNKYYPEYLQETTPEKYYLLRKMQTDFGRQPVLTDSGVVSGCPEVPASATLDLNGSDNSGGAFAAELLPNGDFEKSVSGGWFNYRTTDAAFIPVSITPPSYHITDDVDPVSGLNNFLYTGDIIEEGKAYTLTFDVTLPTGGSLDVVSFYYTHGSSALFGEASRNTVTSSGTQTITFIGSAVPDRDMGGTPVRQYSFLRFESNDAVLDNVTLKEAEGVPCGVASSQNLAREATWSTGLDVPPYTSPISSHPIHIIFSRGGTSFAVSNDILTVSKNYLLSFDILTLGTSTSYVECGTGSISNPPAYTATEAGHYEIPITALDANLYFTVEDDINYYLAEAQIANVTVQEIFPCCYNLYENGSPLLSSCVPFNQTSVQTATDLVSALNMAGTDYSFSNINGLSDKITAKGKPGTGTSLNGRVLELKAVLADGITTSKIDREKLKGGFDANECDHTIWLADEVTLNTASASSTYPYTLSNGDADLDQDGLPGDESFGLSGLPSVPVPAPTQQELKDAKALFMDAWENQYGYALSEEDFLGFEIMDIPAGSELNTLSLPVLDKDYQYMVNAEPYYCFKIKKKDPDCQVLCKPVSDNSDCQNTCHQGLEALQASVLDAKNAIQDFGTASTFGGKSLIDVINIDYTYPGTDNKNIPDAAYNDIYSNPEAQQLYETYDLAYKTRQAFDENLCIAHCTGTAAPNKCGTCDGQYNACVEDNRTDLQQGYDYLMSQWQSGAFPYAAVDLKSTDGDGMTVVNEILQTNLGNQLFDFIYTNLSNGTSWTLSNWQTLATTNDCSNCDSPGNSGCGVVAYPEEDIAQMLITPLQDANASCLTDYNECLKLSDASTSDDYLCHQQISNCQRDQAEFEADMNYVSDPADPCYGKILDPETGNCLSLSDYNQQCAVKYDCANNNRELKKSLIRQTLSHLYTDSEKIASETDRIYEENQDKTVEQLAAFLLQYEDYEQCTLGCQSQRDAAFLSWVETKKQKTREAIYDNYVATCFSTGNETFTVTFSQELYHYTLYYYNKANQLVKTVPPEGVDYVDKTQIPNHRMVTTYVENSIGELKASTTPDGGNTLYLYDKAGRIRFSQNDEQRARSLKESLLIFSYTKYDNEERIIEVGEYRGSNQGGGDFISTATAFVDNNSYPSVSADCYGVTSTTYDASAVINGSDQGLYMNGRVSSIRNENAVTYYSYDAHGRVKWVIQKINSLNAKGSGEFKKMEYEYDILTAKVIKVNYQKGVPGEQLSHHFIYDDDQRLKQVEVSKNGADWYTVATYEYYMHGPLKNVIYGDAVQKTDYVYNIQGWLKAINNPFTLSESNYPEDVFAQVIHYYEGYQEDGTYVRSGDYKRTGTGFEVAATVNGFETTPGSDNIWTKSVSGTSVYNLYNGNISGIVSSTAFGIAGSSAENLLVQGYKYDVLNRLKESFTETHNTLTTNFTGFNTVPEVAGVNNYFKEKLTYDANGNILNLLRTSGIVNNTKIDNMSYTYALDSQNDKEINNKLLHITDTDGFNDLGDIVGNKPEVLPPSPVEVCVDNSTPNAPQWQLRNDWSDQNQGSIVTNETSDILLTQPSGRESYIWMLETNRTFNVQSGETYTISFDYLSDGTTSTTSLEAGLAAGTPNWNGPVLISGTQLLSSGYSSSAYQTLSFQVTANASNANGYIAIKITWPGTQVTSPVLNRFRNFSVCHMETPASGSSGGDIVLTDWFLGNSWSDQNGGSSVTANGAVLSVNHRQWGQDYIWLMESGNAFNVTQGQNYVLTFEIEDDNDVALSSVDVGLVTSGGIEPATFLQAVQNVAGPFSNTTYTSYSVSFTAAASGTVYAAYKLNWSGQPAHPVTVSFRNFCLNDGCSSEELDGPLDYNFVYDEKGRLIADKESEIAEIKWTPYDKVAEIIRIEGSSKPNLKFTYDARQQRILKEVDASGTDNDSKRWYVYDAGGKLMATYTERVDNAGTPPVFELEGQPVYGSARLGVINRKLNVSGTEAEQLAKMAQFELTDHLGNVRAVFSGVKRQVEGPVIVNDNFSDGTVQGWLGGNATVTNTGGVLHASVGLNGAAYKSITTVPGANYTFSIDIVQENTTPIHITSTSNGERIVTETVNGNGNYTFNFTAPGTQANITVGKVNNDYNTALFTIDNVTITEIKEQAEPLSLIDYYPFGMQMPGRNFSADDYRYGFNGKEKDNEIKGAGNSYDFGARMYDGRLGRWMSVDPLTSKYPYLSPYVGMGNKPTIFIDRDGRDTWFFTADGKYLGKTIDNLPNAATVINATLNMFDLVIAKNAYLTEKNILSIRNSSSNITYNLDKLLEYNAEAEAREHTLDGEIEHGMFLGMVDGEIAPIGKLVRGYIGEMPDWRYASELKELEQKGKVIYAMVHDHPVTEQGPSPLDVMSGTGKGKRGYLNVEIDNKYLYFYYNRRTQISSRSNFYGNNKDWISWDGRFPSLYENKITGSIIDVKFQYLFRIPISGINGVKGIPGAGVGGPPKFRPGSGGK